jgi:hypothetical protein
VRPVSDTALRIAELASARTNKICQLPRWSRFFRVWPLRKLSPAATDCSLGVDAVTVTCQMFSIEHASIGAGCFAIKVALLLIVSTEFCGAVKHCTGCAEIRDFGAVQHHVW